MDNIGGFIFKLYRIYGRNTEEKNVAGRVLQKPCRSTRAPKGHLVQLSIYLLHSIPDRCNSNIIFAIIGCLLCFKVIYFN